MTTDLVFTGFLTAVTGVVIMAGGPKVSWMLFGMAIMAFAGSIEAAWRLA